MKLAAIHHVAIIVSDYEKSKDFYVNKLGFAVVRENFRKERNDWKLDLCVGDGADAIELEIFAEPNPPKRVNRPEADKDGVILVHVITFSGDGRARGRIAHFDGATGFLIHPVQIGLGIRNFRLNLKNVCTDSICQIFGNFCGDTAGRKIGDKSFAHDNALPLDNFV